MKAKNRESSPEERPGSENAYARFAAAARTIFSIPGSIVKDQIERGKAEKEEEPFEHRSDAVEEQEALETAD